MRKGFNPEKDKLLEIGGYTHQVIIPVYIPTSKDYYTDSIKILKACLESLINTIHEKTFISIINNGSCQEVKELLQEYLNKSLIQELVHTDNIGKLNAILKALAGHNIPLITIADSDVFFINKWQEKSYEVFNAFPMAGTVGLVPQFNMFSNHCTNTIFDNFLNKDCKFYKVEQPIEMWKFYRSVGWDLKKDHFYFESILGIKKSGVLACVGSGHFVATYRKELFDQIQRYLPYKLGGTSEKYLDGAAMNHGLWKLTTNENYAYHMGNVWEDWMKSELKEGANKCCVPNYEPNPVKDKPSKLSYLVKNKIFKRILRIKVFNKLFLYYMRMPTGLLRKYPKIYY